jgi:hypothetical protein
LLSPPIDELVLPSNHALAVLLCVIPPADQMQKTVDGEKSDFLLR